MMYFDQYQTMAKKTAIFPPETAIPYLAMGLAGEVGEVLNKLKKCIRDGRSTDGIADELGDCLWYLAVLSDHLGANLSEVANNNLKKLASRQERGQLGGSGDER